MKRLTVRGPARRDLAEARAWYRNHGQLAANQFADRIDEAFDAICRSPSIYAAVFQDIRGFLLRGFPYAVYYRDEPNRVRVIAVMHTSRDPDTWQSRA